MKSFPPVSCKYGAPSGRISTFPPDNVRVRLRLSRARLSDGVYDPGGVYWGSLPGTGIYCGHNQSGVRIYVRATDSGDAATKILSYCAEGSTCGGRKMVNGYAISIALWKSQHELCMDRLKH